MRKIFFALMLFCSLNIDAQTDAKKTQSDSTRTSFDLVEVKTIELPDSTAIGNADGTLVTKEIGPSGGTITSDDNRVELIFPAGALTETKTISVQPIINLIPNGNGKGYRFEPSGTEFKKPVEIIFHYSAEENEICPALLQFMAIQSSDGTWDYMDYDDWDSTTKTLKGYISHFSAFIDGNFVTLNNKDITLRARDHYSLYLTKVQPPPKKQKKSKNIDGDELPSLPSADVVTGNKKINWSVNDIEGGTQVIGEIIPETGDNIEATYFAPAFLPSAKKIIVKLTVNVSTSSEKAVPVIAGKKARGRGKMLTINDDNPNRFVFACNVHLYDEYEVLVRDTMEVRAEMGTFVADSGSFLVRIENNQINIKDVRNYNPYMFIKHNPPRPFKLRAFVEPPCLGPVNIGGLSEQGRSFISYTSEVSPTPDAPQVVIDLYKQEVLVCKFYVGSPAGNSPVEELKLEQQPGLIIFKADGQAHDIPTNTRVAAHIYITPVR